jgi:hypothetical protein
LVPSGSYDPALARQRIAEWKAKEAAHAGMMAGGPRANGGVNGTHVAAQAQQPKSPTPAPTPEPEFDSEVGF